MDIDENTSFVFQKITYKHNIFIHVWDIYSMGHKFGVFTMLPFNIIYIHIMNMSQQFCDVFIVNYIIAISNFH